MSQTIAVEIFKFDELSDEAKERARQWYRDGGLDYEWWDHEDSKACAAILGIDIKNIWFSGFYSQGDGACFEGSYRYAHKAVQKIKEYAPDDARLHDIARDLQDIQRRNFYSLTATVKQHGHYSHEYCTDIEVSDSEGYSPAVETCEAIQNALRSFMRWIYRQLESEYEYLNSDESVDETIRMNEYDFESDGTRWRY